MIPFTKKDVEDWAGKEVFARAERGLREGAVVSASYDKGLIRGTIRKQPRALKTEGRILPNGLLENHCKCRESQDFGTICWHITAVCLDLVAQSKDPERLRKLEMEKKRAERQAAFDEKEFLQRAERDALNAVEARLRVGLAPHWREGVGIDRIPVTCAVSTREHGTMPADEFPKDVPLGFDEIDDNVLFVLEDICEGPVPGAFEVSRGDFVNVLKLMGGKVVYGPNARVVGEAAPQKLAVEMNEESGRLVMYHEVITDSGEVPVLVAGPQGGFAWVDGAIRPLEPYLPGPLQELYVNPVMIGRTSVPAFLRNELPALRTMMPVETELSPDWISTRSARPNFRLHIKGSPASLAGTLHAVYDLGLEEDPVELIAAKPGGANAGFAVPEADDLLAYRVRNLAAEEAALVRLGETGFTGFKGDELAPIVGQRLVANFLASALPALRRKGWKVDLEGRVEKYFDEVDFATPVVEVAAGGGSAGNEKSEWFEVGFDFELGDGSNLAPAEIQRAIRMGDSYVEKGGKKVFFDRDAVESMQGVFRDCASGEASKPGHFRMKKIHAAYVKSSLDALDGVDIEAGSNWTTQAKQQNRDGRVTRVDVGPELEGILRPYQHEGVNWLRFWERNGYAGILADDMGLGKTLQTLTWLQLERCDKELDHVPSLIVCPTSLVENWIEEGEKWTPGLRFLNITGPTRKERFGQIDEVDVAVTSYALVRRDFDELQRHDFACVVLDEGQHIKNPKSQSSKAVKKMRGHCKLVLTGTPVENRVTDLWSIMDFLMPGYLGSEDHFKTFYEGPISKGPGAEAEAALGKLRRKLHPFLIRRLKTEVAKDLPPKIEKVVRCSMTPDQKKVYEELRDHSRRKMFDLVDSKGFNKARMEILTMLLRLRQASCHIDLLKLDEKPVERPSAKLELFLELLDEAMSGDHRMLVFSQFTSLLGILRETLEEKGLRYCYLDGSTKNRQALVKEFNADAGIPVFLISLKAGGTGLNLTGADMVVHFDPWWNPAAENQATDRAYRIGQKRTVYAMKLIARDTVEEKVLEMQEKKRRIIDATLSGDEQVMEKLSWDDVQDLMEL